MPFGGSYGTSRKLGSIGRDEFLKFPAGLDAIRSVVVNAASVPSAASGDYVGRRILKAGTILTKIPGASTNQYRRYTSATSEVPEGILGLDLEFADATQNSDQPAPLYYHGCVFDIDAILDFGTYATVVRASLPTSKFES
jgi:hypothetical protein